MIKLITNYWALFLGYGVLIIAHGLQGNLLGVRAVFEKFNMTKRTGLIGTKIGNSSYYDESGKSLPVTILKISDCVVSDVKTIDKNGYNSIQLVSIDGKYSLISLMNVFFREISTA